MKFTKMHSVGNDYIIINCFEEQLDVDPARLAELLCARHYGIGADGIMLIQPSEVAEYKVNIWNADGSRTPLMSGIS